MATVGYSGKLETNGAAVAATGLATTNTTGNSYQLNDATKRVLDPSTAIVVYDGVTPIAAANVTIDFLFGIVTLSAPPVGAVTVDASYHPMLTLAEVRSFDIDCQSNLLDKTFMHATDLHRKRISGLKDVSGSVTSLDTQTTDLDAGAGTVKPYDIFAAGTPLLLSATYGATIFRAWILLEGVKETSSFDDLVNATLTWKLSARSATSGAGTGEGVSYAFGT